MYRARLNPRVLLRNLSLGGLACMSIVGTAIGVPQYLSAQNARESVARQMIAQAPSDRVLIDGTLGEALAQRGFYQGSTEYRLMLADTICRNTQHALGNVEDIVEACQRGDAVRVPPMRAAQYDVASLTPQEIKRLY